MMARKGGRINTKVGHRATRDRVSHRGTQWAANRRPKDGMTPSISQGETGRAKPTQPALFPPRDLGYISVRAIELPEEMAPRDEAGNLRRAYGTISARYWLGTKGRSLLYASTIAQKGPILRHDAEAYAAEVRAELAAQLSLQIEAETGLARLLDTDDPRIEWHDIWEATPRLPEDVQAFEAGMDTSGGFLHPAGFSLPAGIESDDDVRGLVRHFKEKATAQIDREREREGADEATERDAYYGELASDYDEEQEREGEGDA